MTPTRFVIPATNFTITRAPVGDYRRGRYTLNGYPTATEILDRAHTLAYTPTNVPQVFDDLCLSDMVFGNAVVASKVIEDKPEDFLSTNRPLTQAIRRGLQDREAFDRDAMGAWTTPDNWMRTAIRYAASNDAQLLEHVKDIYGAVRVRFVGIVVAMD
jgi:hypothetical protein